MIESLVSKNVHPTDGTTNVWDYTFDVNESTDIAITYEDSEGNETAVTTGYTVNTYNSTVVYPNTGAPKVSGGKVTIYRATPATNTLVIKNQGPFPATSLNIFHDKVMMVCQQLKEKIDRALLLPISFSGQAPTLPAAQEGYSLVWDSAGNFKNSNLKGDKGDTGATGPAGPAGSGAGDVLGPVSNTDLYVPQWNGANTKTLKNGLAVGTSANCLVQLDASAKLPAVDGSQLTNVPASGTVNGSQLASLSGISAGAGVIPSANLPVSAIISLAYPVGSIFISTVSTNPNTLLGFGTWQAYGAGRVIVGFDSGQTEFDTLGETGGEKTHTLTTPEIPSHTHDVLAGYNGGSTSAIQRNNFDAGDISAQPARATATGGGLAHNNLQPYIVANLWKRTA